MADLLIENLRGGMCDTNMPAGLAEDQCALAINVEWFNSTVGERRLGCETFDLTGSDLDTEDGIIHLTEQFPNNNLLVPEYWAVSATVDGGSVWARYQAGTWFPVVPDDALLTAAPDLYNIQSVALNGKLFFAYPTAVDRMHVWDGTDLRPTGLAQPIAAPTAVTEGSGTFATTRYYRIRYVARNGTVVLRRSEPSDSVQFDPPGTGLGATITRPALLGEGETDWELEASLELNGFYYRIQTIAVGTTTADDEIDLITSTYSEVGTLSATIGDYLLQPSARFVAADGDRLLLGGHWTDETLQSRVSWSPVYADPGVGNDERLPLSTGGDNYVDLDNYEGGMLTGISQMANGTWYAFKWTHIYKMARTGDITHAYEPIAISKMRGALPGSIVGGVDEAGRACLYFLDPAVGPCSLGSFGQRDHTGLRNTWQRVNITTSAITCRVAFYADKQQVHWWVAADGSTTPTLKIVLQVTEIRQTSGASASRGLSLADGTIATAHAAYVWHELTELNGVTRMATRPFIGLPAPDYIQRCDVGDDDNGDAYRAIIQTRPYYLAGLLKQWGSMQTAILATANADTSIVVSCIRDFGKEQNDRTTDLAATGSEAYVVKILDDLVMSESAAIQFQIADPV